MEKPSPCLRLLNVERIIDRFSHFIVYFVLAVRGRSYETPNFLRRKRKVFGKL